MRRIRSVAIKALAVTAVIMVAAFAYSLSLFDDAYAQWGAADMVIDFMEDHDGRWPSNWDDLEPYFDNGGSRVAGWSYGDFQRHVWIDFDVDADELRMLALRLDRSEFNVIDSTSILGPQFGDGPNGMILRYLNPTAPNPNPPVEATIELSGKL